MRKRFVLTLGALALALALIAAPVTSYAGCSQCGGDKKEQKKDQSGGGGSQGSGTQQGGSGASK